MTTLRLILGDQLSRSLPSLEGVTPNDIILMCEVREEATYVPHHKKKIALIFAAMRHFADELRQENFDVHYIALKDEGNTGTLQGEVKRAIKHHHITRIVMTKPAEYRLLDAMQSWQELFNIPVILREDTRFLATSEEFSRWVGTKKQLRMEFFYREMRRKYKILLDEKGEPEGGQWNYDKENRKPLKRLSHPLKRVSHKKSQTLNTILTLVEQEFSHHIGKLLPFHYAVTRPQALRELEDFLDNYLPHFGDYQDAMVKGEPFLYHSLLASYLNIGLLLPLEICEMAEKKYREGHAPLNAVEGFIRQILGWREFIRGIYWHFMPNYGEMNALNATSPLPQFYWDAKTDMACLSESITHTLDHAYSHHIQRLMLTGNFALLAGLDVKEVQEWYLAVYSDAFEWVEMPNTLGMALFGDGGIVASKPYAASGNYIHKMSNYCTNCAYNVKETVGNAACPFNALYWHFMVRHEKIFRGNQRMPYVYATWEKFGVEKQTAILAQAQRNLEKLSQNRL